MVLNIFRNYHNPLLIRRKSGNGFVTDSGEGRKDFLGGGEVWQVVGLETLWGAARDPNRKNTQSQGGEE